MAKDKATLEPSKEDLQKARLEKYAPGLEKLKTNSLDLETRIKSLPRNEKVSGSFLREKTYEAGNQSESANLDSAVVTQTTTTRRSYTPAIDQNEKILKSRFKKVKRIAQAGSFIARISGQHELAEGLKEAVEFAHEGAQEGKHGVHKGLANLAGKGAGLAGQHAGKLSGGKLGNLSKGGGAALGGAVSAALQGEGAVGVAKGALSWYLLYIAFGALPTLAGSVPALLYLDFHYAMSKLGSKIFGEMTYWQKLVLLFANMLAALAIFLLVMIFLIAACGTWTNRLLLKYGAGVTICEALESTGSYVTGQTSSQPSNFTGRFSTAQWNTKVDQYASQYNIDACILKTVIQKESQGNSQAIGHDAHDRNTDPFQIQSPPQYNLNWSYSHGIGLTQWTIFPQNGRNRWVDGNTPSRQVYNHFYTVQNFLDPDTSLSLTARIFSERLSGNGNDLYKAFRDYNGSGPRAEQYARDSVNLYNICKAQP